jgi:glycosyltransferase involved in cell wall biosynthesis
MSLTTHSTTDFDALIAPLSMIGDVPLSVPTPRSLTTVLHVINGEHFSGAERVQQLLGKQLGKLGFDARFACVKPDRFPELCGLDKKQVVETPMRGRFDLRVISALAKYVRENSVALLHAHTPRTAMIASLLAFRTGLPWVYHVHSPASRDSTRGFVNRVNTWIESYSISNCDCLITVSASLAKEMQRLGVAEQHLVTVPNGVPAIEPIDARARKEQRHWRLGIVALMRPRKGVEVALQTMQQLKAAGRPVTLELIGGFETAEYQRQIMTMVEELDVKDVVEWTGFTSDVPEAIRGLDALILPSLFGEGMPMVVLEALAAAVPVVATSVEGTPEVVRDGVEGMLAEPRSVESLVTKIEELISDRGRWIAMSDRALTRHREQYSDTRMAEGVAAAYERVLANR